MRLLLILTGLLAFQGAAASDFDDMKALAEQGDADRQALATKCYESNYKDCD